ncbi:T9SS sorting signal type C domain-containing protein [Flavobacterium sp. Fl-318]|uniref:T9SS sorting signal type C domain-containing protein n=1 Tax=Flavobacterium cupriresistens TaxID=2893885 RepID=A0ABU4RH29_9FLAO|nr:MULTISPECIES: T9SS sorting signal type C domain-containing protein [unclassified Flavobacterium]MDX6191576.1 T9SS sorting signal type C domain-containing protein [Flavobacterium sp. Fl-318]UFH43338.1 T9SS sorting signal type C domain-containing protein [Flavobacterium sp. F-323]
MKKKLPAFPLQFLMHCFSQKKLHYKKTSFLKVKLSFLFLFVFGSLWAQPPHTFTADGSLVVPAGITSMDVQAWGGGGAGGGASGAGLLAGRSGAGGGGGAFAHGAITVVAGNTLAVKVAGVTTGTTATGGNGGSSTITGFETILLAVGGHGGVANTAGGAPAGGAGGLNTASFGSIAKTSGVTGGNGASALLSLGLSSGAGGKGGDTGGGAGGAALSSLLLGNGPGNFGTPPGGGGSGAMNSASGGAQSGGNGARGQVIVTYTCPTYSITGISGAGVCNSVGSTSVITVTSSAASLPIGVYTVTYNRTNPTGTALTAAMTVTSAGTGTFTAVGLTTIGTSTITVTNLTSGVCSSNIAANNTTNVIVSATTVGGTISGAKTICAGATSGLLTLSGYTGTILKWQSSGPFGTWDDIVNTAATYTSGPLTETIDFRAVIQNGSCAAVNSATVTITVSPLPQGSLTANGPFCATGAGQLTFTATAGTGPYTVVYQENGGANRTQTNVTSGTAFATFTTPVTTSTTYTLVSVTGADICARSLAFTGGSATITVNPLPQGSLTANGPFCVTGSGQLTFTATAGTGPYTVVYQENGGANRTQTNVTSGTAFATFTTPVTTSTTYTLVSVTGANSCVRSSGFTGGSATITVNPLPQGSLTANGPFCATGAGQLTFTATAGTGPYTVVYQENGGANRTQTNVTSGTAFATFTTPVITSTTYILVSVTGADTCVRSSGFTSGSATITVNPLPQGSLTANGPFCATGAGQLTFTATAGTGPYTVVYQENGGANRTQTNVTSGTAFATFTTPVITSTTYTLVSVTGADTCIRSSGFTGGSATITVNPLPQGSLTANGPFCATGAGQLTFTATAGTGPYTVVYQENGGANRTQTNVTSGTAFATFTTPVTTSTTYTLVSVTGADTCIRSSGFTGGSATITVNPLPQGSLTANGPFCATGAGQLTFTATAGTGPYTVVYQENGGANRTQTNVTSGAAFATFTTPVITSTTYTLVSVTGADTCVRSSGFIGGSATITVNPLPQGSLTANGPFCATGAGQLTFTATAGTGPYTVVYKENGGADRTQTNVTSGTAFATFTTPVTTSTTYTLVSVTGADTCVRSSGFTSGSATITVNPLPQGSLTANGPFCATGSGQLTFTATTGTGPYTVVYKENGGADRTQTNVTSGVAFATFTTPVTTSTTYTLVSVTGADTCVRSSAFTGGSATITIIPQPTAPVNGGITDPTCLTPTGTLVLNGLPNMSNYTITQSGSFPNTYAGGAGPDPTTYTITGLAPGTYNFIVQYSGSCASPPLSNIVINPLVTNTYTTAGGWSGGTPTINHNIIFADDYATTGDINSCTCKVNAGKKVTINALNTLTVTNALTVDSAPGTELLFENNASLVQANDNPLLNSGSISYKRTGKQIFIYDYIYWSTPVSPQKLVDVSPLTLSDKYFSFNGTNWVMTSSNTEMIIGKGYIIRGPQSYSNTVRADYTAQFVGAPNNGALSGETMDAGNFYLIGNPYPSALDADLFLPANSFLDGTIFFWTHNTPIGRVGPYKYNADDYASYNVVGGVAISAKSDPGHTDNPATDAGVKPTGKIGAGQSFFATTVSAGTVAFTNAMRLGGADNSQFFKIKNTSKNTDLERHRIWLDLENEEGAFKQLLIGYVEGATNGHDNRFDGVTLDGNPFLDFYSINSNKKYVIQGRALPFLDTDTIPLGYRSAIVSDFTISIDDSDGNLVHQAIYIEDKITGQIHDLRESDYKFSTGIGVFDDRFILRYVNKSLGVGEFENKGKEIIVSAKDKIININASESTISEILIFDVSGNMIYKKSAINDPAFQIVNLKSQDQLLFVKVKLENNTVSIKKVMF